MADVLYAGPETLKVLLASVQKELEKFQDPDASIDQVFDAYEASVAKEILLIEECISLHEQLDTLKKELAIFENVETISTPDEEKWIDLFFKIAERFLAREKVLKEEIASLTILTEE